MPSALDHDNSRIDTRMLLSAVWRRLGRIGWVTVGLLALTFAVLTFVPKMYESSASILVEQRDSSFLRASNDTGFGGGSVSDEMAVASQVELVQSRDTMLSVIETENLRDEVELNTASTGIVGVFTALIGPPPKRDLTEIVLANVKDRLTVIQERDSRIISVYFRSESPELAARVANAIANAHVSRRAGLVIEDTADASAWLEVEIDKLRQKVGEADAKVANFRIDNDLYNGKDGTSSLIDQQLSDIATQITQSQERQSTATSRATVLRALIQQGKPIDSVPAIQDSATIAQLAEQKSSLQSEKAELSARLLPNHPSLVALNAQITEINAQMLQEGGRIADALEAEADIEKSIEASLRDQLTRLKATASGDLTNGVTLAELEREAKAQRDLLETYLVRYRDASARTDVNSALTDVRVVTAAAPSSEPASPKTMLILIAVAVLSLAGQIGQILFAELGSGRALIEDEARQSPSDAASAASPQAFVVPDDALAASDAGLSEMPPAAETVAALERPGPARRASDFAAYRQVDPDQLALDLNQASAPEARSVAAATTSAAARHSHYVPRSARPSAVAPALAPAPAPAQRPRSLPPA
ncbi:MAG: GumC family protein, partial [Alphaproteobacteria bacterium]|nr:GumC family protein [Alphaproteobacteria bacterium]